MSLLRKSWARTALDLLARFAENFHEPRLSSMRSEEGYILIKHGRRTIKIRDDVTALHRGGVHSKKLFREPKP